MILECWKCKLKMKRGKVVKHFIYEGQLYMRIKCRKCKLHTDILLHIEDKRDWKVD